MNARDTTRVPMPNRPIRARGTTRPVAVNGTRPKPLELLRELQRSLEPEVVMDTFASRLREHFAVEGFTLEHPEHRLHWGAEGEHAFAASLELDGDAVGHLEFYRQRAFGRRERDELALLADLLLQPLRNALAHASLQKQAFEDGLTGLLNRQALDRMLPRELAAAERNGQTTALVMIDLDCLKQINDTGGHAAGDQALRRIAQAIAASLRQSDLAFRIGGDEFMLLLPATSPDGAMRVVERIQGILRDAGELDGQTLTFSAGIASSATGIAPDYLIEQADQAMYLAKRAGKNRALSSTTMPQRPGQPDFSADRIAARMART